MNNLNFDCTKTNLIDMYLDYCNNFITLRAFAKHYQINDNVAQSVINRGRIFFYSSSKGSREFFTNNQINLLRDRLEYPLSENNAKYVANKYEKKLIAEYSA